MPDASLTLRLTIADPVPGVHYSLQDQDNAPVDGRVAAEAPLSFDVPVRLSPDNRLLGPFVRREGKERRFIYIVVRSETAAWNGRAKIDVHNIPPALLDQARAGRILEIALPGRGKDGSPARATVRSTEGWTVV